MTKRLTVSERLSKRLTKDVKFEIVNQWADDRANSVQKIKDKFEYAWNHHDELAYREAMDELLDIKLKSMNAVKGIAKRLIYSDYKDDKTAN